jgi:hypothetical protein
MTKVFDINPDGVVEREATDNELLAREELLESYNARIAKEESNAASKNSLLNRLGITADEAQLLLN